MRVTISGEAGSGKSSVGRRLAKKLKYKFYSMGDIRRKIAADRGISIDELNKQSEHDDSTDKLVDTHQEKIGKDEDNFVLDSRLGFHFIPQSVKVYLTADLGVRAQRIFQDKRGEETHSSAEETAKKLEERKRCDQKRYRNLYKIDCYNPKLYDIVVDTTNISIEEVVNEVMQRIKTFK